MNAGPARRLFGRTEVAVGPSGAGDVVPLSRRVTSLTAVRAATALVVLAGMLLHDGKPSMTASAVLAGYVVASSALALLTVTTPHRRTALALLGTGLCLDGAAVEIARQVGWVGTSGPLLLGVLLAAVCLLGSFRTGVRLAIWQSVLALVRDAAEQAHLVRSLPDGRSLTAELVLMWLLVLVISSAAAISERELRRRRYDAEALQRFATVLHACDAPEDVLAETVRFAVEALDAGRALACQLVGGELRLRSGHGLPPDAPAAGPWPQGGLLTLAERPGETARALHLDPARDPWLATQLPRARRLVVLPLATSGPDDGTWVVFEHLGGRGSAVERRVVATAGQAGATAALATSRALLFQRQRAVAVTDGLTGLLNRRAFDELMSSLAPPGHPPFAVVLCDVDHFKRVNDTHGHQVGDEVLVAVAAALAAAAPAGASVARYGGEEFVVVLPDTAVPDAVSAAEGLRAAVAALTRPVPVTASFGVAGSTGGPPGETVGRADAALYRAKTEGRNRVISDLTLPAQRVG